MTRPSLKIDGIELQHIQHFDQLHDDFKYLLSEIVESQVKLTGLIAAEHVKTRDHTLESMQNLTMSTETGMKRMRAAAATEAQREQLVRSLKFEGMNERRNRINDSHHDTFHWVLRPREEMKQHSPTQGDDSDGGGSSNNTNYEDRESDWESITSDDGSSISYGTPSISDDSTRNTEDENEEDIGEEEISDEGRSDKDGDGSSISGSSISGSIGNSFIDWLRSDEPMYWIQGKPGSGKSTLVKFIAESPLTQEALGCWRPGTQILSHYFWKLGGGDQRTIKGFWFSIAYQILTQSRPEVLQQLTDHILTTFPTVELKDVSTDWSTRELMAACLAIIRHHTEPICIFLDGLDEIDDKDGDAALKDAISNILQQRVASNIKFCLASRAEFRFERWLGELPTLKLHHLTHRDMIDFIHQKISKAHRPVASLSDGIVQRICWDLARKAQGVFLWLALATDSVVQGIEQDDDEHEIFARIEHLPSEIEGLYWEMWKRGNEGLPHYHKEASRLLRLCLTHSQISPWDDLRLVGVTLTADEHYQQELDLITKHGFMLTADTVMQWERMARRIKIRCGGLVDVQSNRGKVDDDPRILYARISFVHRTASDFLMNTSEGQQILSPHSASIADDMRHWALVSWATDWAACALNLDFHAHFERYIRYARYFDKLEEEAMRPAIRFYFELECTWGWRFPKKALGLVPKRWLPHYPLLLSLSSSTWWPLEVEFQNLKGVQNIKDLKREATIALRDLMDLARYLNDVKDYLSYASNGSRYGTNPELHRISLNLLRCGADPTAIGPLPHRTGIPTNRDRQGRYEANALEVMIVSAWEYNGWHIVPITFRPLFLNDHIRDTIIAMVAINGGLDRCVPIIWAANKNCWVAAQDSLFDKDMINGRPRFEYFHSSLKFVFDVNLAHLLLRYLNHLPGHKRSPELIHKFRGRHDETLRQPARLVGIQGKHHYRVLDMPFPAQELWDMGKILKRLKTSRRRFLVRYVEEVARRDVRQTFLKRVDNLEQLLEEEGLLVKSAFNEDPGDETTGDIECKDEFEWQVSRGYSKFRCLLS